MVNSTSKEEKQCSLEMEMRMQGDARYSRGLQNSRRKKAETRMLPIRKLMAESMGPLVDGIKEYFESQENRESRRGRKDKPYTFIKEVRPEVLALITAQTVLDQISREVTLQNCAIKVGSRIEDEIIFSEFNEKHPAIWKNLIRKKPARGKGETARWYARLVCAKLGVETGRWQNAEKLLVGSKLLDIFQQATSLIKIHRDPTDHRAKYIVTATEECFQWLEKQHKNCAFLSPVWLPMVVPPRDWTSPVHGGYMTPNIKKLSLVKSYSPAYLEELNSRWEDMKPVWEAVNMMQRTAWSINDKILDIMEDVWEQGYCFGGMPRRHLIDTGYPPPKTDRVAYRSWCEAASKIHDENARISSKRIQFAKILHIAKRFRDEESIWFPYQLDFRGRAYAIPMFLHPQGNDEAKSLLKFGVGKPISTEEGARWFTIHGANLWGQDKISMDERVKFITLRNEEIKSFVDSPTQNTGWMKADKPWQFLAWCHEWVEFLAQGLSFVSHLPVALDGSCNGLQHYSAILRDPVGGAAVNLIPSEKPADIYGEVATATIKRLEDEVNGISDGEWIPDPVLAQTWLDYGINRKTCKRSVMVLPYGGTQYSTKRFIVDHIDDRTEQGEHNPFGDKGDSNLPAASYLAKHMWAAIGDVVVAARQGMAWIQNVARVYNKASKPISWTTPTGFPVIQAYPKFEEKRVHTKFGDGSIQMKIRSDKPLEVDPRRQVSAIAPNWVHSLDSSHMYLSICRANKYGVDNFSMVHDSYGTHACDAGKLSKALREAFVEMYEENDVVENIIKDLRTLIVDGENDIPEPPEVGALDINRVMQSEYFFA